jgi:hypothetical protein
MMSKRAFWILILAVAFTSFERRGLKAQQSVPVPFAFTPAVPASGAVGSVLEDILITLSSNLVKSYPDGSHQIQLAGKCDRHFSIDSANSIAITYRGLELTSTLDGLRPRLAEVFPRISHLKPGLHITRRFDGDETIDSKANGQEVATSNDAALVVTWLHWSSLAAAELSKDDKMKWALSDGVARSLFGDVFAIETATLEFKSILADGNGLFAVSFTPAGGRSCGRHFRGELRISPDARFVEIVAQGPTLTVFGEPSRCTDDLSGNATIIIRRKIQME